MLGIMAHSHPKRLATVAVRKNIHTVDPVIWQELMKRPDIAVAMESAVFAIEHAKNPGTGRAVDITRPGHVPLARPAPEPGRTSQHSQ